MESIILFLAFGAAGAGTWTVGRWVRARAAAMPRRTPREAAREALGRVGGAVPLVGRSSFEHWDERLLVAGQPAGITPVEFLGLKALGGVLLGALSLGWGIAWVIPAVVVGWFAPDLWIHDRIRAQRAEMLRGLPGFIDMVALAVAAGLDFNQAIARVLAHSRPGLLTFQFRQMFHEINLGSTRRQALEALARRVDVRELSIFTGALIQSDRIGTPLGDTLTTQAALMRDSRLRRAEKLGQEAPYKLLVPVVLFVFPATFIVLLGPVVLQLLNL
jgi:tight adherence protein C